MKKKSVCAYFASVKQFTVFYEHLFNVYKNIMKFKQLNEFIVSISLLEIITLHV